MLKVLVFRHDDVLRIARVKHEGNEPGVFSGRGVARDAMQAAGRFIERFTGLIGFGGLIVDANFVRAFHYAIDFRNNFLKKTKFSLPEAVSLLQSLDIILE